MLSRHTNAALVTPLRTFARGMSSYETSSRPPRVPSGNPNWTERPPPRTGGSPVRPNKPSNRPPSHLLTLADLSPKQISDLLISSLTMKHVTKSFSHGNIRSTMKNKTVAMLFNKRSTRTRVASETATSLLGGNAMFLGGADIQLGVNESLRDSAQVIGSMADGFMARVGDHREVEELAQYSSVPVINALSYLWHPTQILADLLTLHETYSPPLDLSEGTFTRGQIHSDMDKFIRSRVDPLSSLKGKKIAWVGDMNNIVWELMATCPRLGMEMSVAAPAGYDKIDDAVMARLKEHNIDQSITLTNSPKEALHNADIVVTDTWISMGMEAEKEARLKAFAGYQVTNEMVESAGAKADWKFLHCLPRKPEEVDDEVFYGPRSLVFPEAENRKWTTVAVFDKYFGTVEKTFRPPRTPPSGDRRQPSGDRRQPSGDRRQPSGDRRQGSGGERRSPYEALDL